jgi:hypothetical protein
MTRRSYSGLGQPRRSAKIKSQAYVGPPFESFVLVHRPILHPSRFLTWAE